MGHGAWRKTAGSSQMAAGCKQLGNRKWAPQKDAETRRRGETGKEDRRQAGWIIRKLENWKISETHTFFTAFTAYCSLLTAHSLLLTPEIYLLTPGSWLLFWV